LKENRVKTPEKKHETKDARIKTQAPSEQNGQCKNTGQKTAGQKHQTTNT